MANYKGGYQIVDLSDATTTAAAVIEGALDAFKNAHGKPLLIKTPDGNTTFAKVDQGLLGTYSATYISGTNVIQAEVDSDSKVLLTVVCDLEDVTPADSNS